MTPHEMAQVLGRRGGRARALALTGAQRTRIAALGGMARKRSMEVTRRIAVNLRYAAAVAELRGSVRRPVRMRNFAGPLPGIYPRRA